MKDRTMNKITPQSDKECLFENGNMKPQKVANKKARELVEKCKPFNGSNLRGYTGGVFYIVESYNWYPILICNRQTGKWFKNADRYSVSTSRQLSQCIPYGIEVTELNKEGIRDMMRINPAW
jgi:hypothetical protein